MDNDENVEDQLRDAEYVWIVCARLGAIEELGEAWEAQQSIQAYDAPGRVECARGKIDGVSRDDREDVEQERTVAEVARAQLPRIADE